MPGPGELLSSALCWTVLATAEGLSCRCSLDASTEGEQAQWADGSGSYEAPAGCRGGQGEELPSWMDRGTLQRPRPPSPDVTTPSWVAAVLSSL